MLTNKDLYVNGEKVEPAKKTTLPLNVDWQSIVLQKEKENEE